MLTFRLSSLYPLIAFVCIFAAGAYYTHLSIVADRKDYQLLMEEVVSVQAAAIERRLNSSLSSTFILAQEVRRSNGQFKDFDLYAKEVMQTLGAVSNLQLAPNGVAQQIYPLAGNEKAIGHDLLYVDERRAEAWEAINTKTLTLAGPFMLVQGQMGMVGRNPVFLEKNGEQQFWGFTTALIYLKDLLSFTELDQLTQKGYAYELSRLHPDTGLIDIFAHSSSKLTNQLVRKKIRVPNDEWTLAMGRPTDFTSQIIVGLMLSLFTAGIFTLLVRRILFEPNRLRSLVKIQTLQLELLAFNDELTGLANRRSFTEQLDQAILHTQRAGQSLALLYLDLDNFKRINDSTGHADGDRLLTEVAQRLRTSVRETDIVGRLGGDEFAVILMNIKSVEQVRTVAAKIIAHIGKPVQLAQNEAIVGASIGITLAPEDGTSSGELLRNADLAMYESKRAGKNQLSFYNSAMQEQALLSIRLEEELRQALAHEEFALAFQPIIDLSNGQTVKFEALLRWQHPVRGIQYPGSFIEIAEQTGLIVPMGYWVIEAAGDFIQQQMQAGLMVKPVAVNLSVCQLREPDFAERVDALLKRRKIAPHLLELEITESMLMENVELAMTLIADLRRLGIRIAIDDFGTGYSSLSQLRLVPVDILKIDRSFVMNLESNPVDRQMVEAITVMVHKLGLKVVAEGIETVEQLWFLKSIGCDYGQGFLLARPLVPEQALQYPGYADLALSKSAPRDNKTCVATTS
ncbi:signal transduction protein [Oceanisphaera profunda]|uniref:Signal transduction protein n=1 Tax=Oceanisphaera profunda TaxID=1416627 RepID=A0A1Y0D3T8_9GAMM|nr:EAL domain-containing protein [Oceanisphaera profunda]ART82201.1 signal transduction protein [Oceanisphaera profunda]